MSRQQESYRAATSKNPAPSVKSKKGKKRKQDDLNELKKEVDFVSDLI